jgi:quinol monooxygenase YgiN
VTTMTGSAVRPALTAFLPRTGKASDMSVVVVTAFPVPEHGAEVIAAFETSIARVHGEPGVELYALHDGRDRLVMIEKYESERARAEHAKGAALAGLRSALDGKLSSGLDAQVRVRTRPKTRRRACCDRSP